MTKIKKLKQDCLSLKKYIYATRWKKILYFNKSFSGTCPPIYDENQPNHFSAFQYAEHRDLCTMKCNEDDRCCTKDAG